MTQEHVGHNNLSSNPTVTTQATQAGRPRRNVILIVAVLCAVVLIAVGLIPRLFLNRDLRNSRLRRHRHLPYRFSCLEPCRQLRRPLSSPGPTVI
jgi:hypothetical protein